MDRERFALGLDPSSPSCPQAQCAASLHSTSLSFPSPFTTLACKFTNYWPFALKIAVVFPSMKKNTVFKVDDPNT